MINDFIQEIRNNIDFLYMKHSLLVKVIQVSQQIYIEIQRNIIQLATKNICDFKYKELIEIDGIPVVINDDISGWDYELVVSIPSYNFRNIKKEGNSNE